MKLIKNICFLLMLLSPYVYSTQAIAESLEPRITAKKPLHAAKKADAGFELDFDGFEKEKDFLDEPFDFSSKEAETLWNFLVSKNPHLKMNRKDMKFHIGSFARLGSDSYLIQHYAFYYARPKHNLLTELTSGLPMGNYDLGEIKKIGNNKFWLLVSGGDYNHDVASQTYYSLIFEKKPDNSFSVQSSHIADFACRGFEDEQSDGLCGDNSDPELEYPTFKIATRANDVVIKDLNNDGKDDIIFYTIEQDCKTKKIKKKKRTFINMDGRFVEKKPNQKIHADRNQRVAAC